MLYRMPQQDERQRDARIARSRASAQFRQIVEAQARQHDQSGIGEHRMPPTAIDVGLGIGNPKDGEHETEQQQKRPEALAPPPARYEPDYRAGHHGRGHGHEDELGRIIPRQLVRPLQPPFEQLADADGELRHGRKGFHRVFNRRPQRERPQQHGQDIAAHGHEQAVANHVAPKQPPVFTRRIQRLEAVVTNKINQREKAEVGDEQQPADTDGRGQTDADTQHDER